MGSSLRIFLVDDDDSLRRLPLARYERLLRGEAGESLPQYAGRRVRYVLVSVDVVNRKPVEIVHVQHSMLAFDSKGRLDQVDRKRKAKLAIDLLPALSGDDPEQVIDARHRFAKKRYDSEYRWEPTPKVRAAIMNAIFGEGSSS